ncbi:hypothetical protein GCM10020255_066880 [Rhodococcus baikonurensis]
MHAGEEVVEVVEEQLRSVAVHRIEDLLADETLAQALERLGVDVDIAVEHRVDEGAVCRGQLHLDLLRHERPAGCAERLLEEAVDVSVATEDRERLGLHVDDAGRLDISLVDGTESRTGQDAFGVVAVGVALDGFDRKPIENGRNRMQRFDRALADGVRLHSGSLSESDSHLLSPSMLVPPGGG